MRKSLVVLGILGCCWACQPLAEDQSGKKVIAQVFDKQLYLDKVQEFIPDGTSVEDSLLMLDAYTQRWIREALMLHIAEENISEAWRIEELVEDYRASLVRHNYEQILVEELLDSTITAEELNTFYERNKDQYELQTTIVRCDLIKLPSSVRLPNNFDEWWKQGKKSATGYQQLGSFCKMNAEVSIINDSTWYSIDELAGALPKGTLTEQNVRSKQEFTQRNDQYQYYFRAYDIINKKEIAPFSYIKDQARRFLLKQKKEELLKKFKEDLYQEALKDGEIKINLAQ